MRTPTPARARRSVTALSVSTITVALIACVGDDPVGLAPGSPVDSSGESPGTADGGSDAGVSTDGETADATVPCAPNETRCGDVCVDLSSSSDHCARCNRSCGGAKCELGVCGVDTFATGLTGLNAFALDETHVYFTLGNFVRRCPKAGPCAGAAVQTLADFTGQNDDGTGAIMVAGSRIIFVGAVNGSTIRLYNCPVTGCDQLKGFASSRAGFADIAIAGEQVYFYNPMSGVQSSTCSANGDCTETANRASNTFTDAPLAATAIHYYFAKKNGSSRVGIARCPASENSCTTAEDVASVENVQKFWIRDDLLVIFWPGGQGGGSRVGRCSLEDCKTITDVRRSTLTFTDATLEGDHLFWIEEGDLKTCPITSCAAPTTLASGLNEPRDLQVDEQFVYWIEKSGPEVSTIRRVAR